MVKETIKSPEPATVQEQGNGKGVLFPVETLISSKQFKDYHPDFLRALLTKAAYTKKEAEEIVFGYFKKGGSK